MWVSHVVQHPPSFTNPLIPAALSCGLMLPSGYWWSDSGQTLRSMYPSPSRVALSTTYKNLRQHQQYSVIFTLLQQLHKHPQHHHRPTRLTQFLFLPFLENKSLKIHGTRGQFQSKWSELPSEYLHRFKSIPSWTWTHPSRFLTRIPNFSSLIFHVTANAAELTSVITWSNQSM